MDRTGHLFHMQQPWALELLERGGLTDWVDHERDARVRVQGHTVPYPIQYNLAGLPPSVIAGCLLGLCAAKPVSGVGRPFSQWARSSFGDGLWRLFFEPYNRKLWQFDLDEMTADWTGRFVPRPDLRRAIEGALTPRLRDPSGYNAVFSYPANGGSQAIPDALARSVADLRCGCRIVAVNWRDKVVTIDNGEKTPYSSLVSTVPITDLIAMLEPRIPELDDIALGLHHNSIGYVAFAGPTPPPDWHWIYAADASVRPFRVGNLGSYASDLAPAGHSLVCVEQAFAGSDACRVPDQELITDAEGVLTDLGLRVGDGLLRPIRVGRLSPAYVVFTAWTTFGRRPERHGPAGPAAGDDRRRRRCRRHRRSRGWPRRGRGRERACGSRRSSLMRTGPVRGEETRAGRDRHTDSQPKVDRKSTEHGVVTL